MTIESQRFPALIPMLLAWAERQEFITAKQSDILGEQESPEEILETLLIIVPNTDDLFKKLIRHNREDLRALPLTITWPVPLHIIERLTRDESAAVRECVAVSPHTPASLLQVLANDEVSFVREAALKYLSSPTPPT